MIRWYDWVIAVLVADIINIYLIKGFSSPFIWESIVCGAIAGLIFRAWESIYCQFRLFQETNRGK